MFARLFAPTIDVQAHCDLPCGVYDPAQARIEAESVKAIIAKVADNDDPDFRTRAILIKEQRSGCCGPTTSSPRTSRSTPSCTPS
jgi:nickel superoxide dismutase